MTLSPRTATPKDFPEIHRLALLMWREERLHEAREHLRLESGDWDYDAAHVFSDALSSGQLMAFVVDHPTQNEQLIACGCVWIHQILPAFWIPNGKLGYFQWFYTDPEFRKQGIASGIVQACRHWLDSQGVTLAHLHGSEHALSLYEELGFAPTFMPNMWLDDIR